MSLEALALILGIVHFAVPLAYYAYLRRYVRRPWNLKVDEGYKPTLTVIVPTYDEAEFIEARLDNIAEQDYPKDKLEVIVVDSASIDGTFELVKKWSTKPHQVSLKLIDEPERKGKLHALNSALVHVHPESDLVVFTDADAFWGAAALNSTVNYFADPEVGVVTGSISYIDDGVKLCEDTYRSYYNVLRVAESKMHSTPIHNGPLIAIRMNLLQQVGLPNYPGSDDSAFGSFVAFMGYKAIQVGDVTVREPTKKNQFRRKIRRAQHLLLNFLKTKRYAKNMEVYIKSSFDTIWKMEWWIHVVNPWFLVTSSTLLVSSMLFHKSIVAAILLGGAAILLALKAYRMWVLQQVCLIVASLRTLWTKEVVWNK